MHHVEAIETTSADRATTWSVLADGAAWADWGPWRSVEIAEGPDGLNALRVLRTPFSTSRERVVVWEPGERYVYRVESGMGLRDYTGTVTLGDAPDGGTRINWRSEFSHAPWIWRLLLPKVIRDVTRAAAREADRRAAASA